MLIVPCTFIPVTISIHYWLCLCACVCVSICGWAYERRLIITTPQLCEPRSLPGARFNTVMFSLHLQNTSAVHCAFCCLLLWISNPHTHLPIDNFFPVGLKDPPYNGDSKDVASDVWNHLWMYSEFSFSAIAEKCRCNVKINITCWWVDFIQILLT